jgi:xanthine/CO dehydrogenase XdhC/CoxF family maturation factor
MKALQQIIKRVAENPRSRRALATLVQTEGSTYRKPGARMLDRSDGGTLGVLAAVVWREEVGRRGQKVIDDASAILLSFDTKLLYGCDGQLKILIEPLPAAEPNGNLITEIGRLLKNRETCRIRVCFEGATLGSELLRSDALLTEQRGVLIDAVPLPVRLLLFGTGPEIEPINQLRQSRWVVERSVTHPN